MNQTSSTYSPTLPNTTYRGAVFADFFNGKEKDYESGLHYYGARYYWSELPTGWLSVDPMADKYPSLSPYNYCAWNSVKLVDPDGEDAMENDDWYKDANGHVHWNANVHSQADLKKVRLMLEEQPVWLQKVMTTSSMETNMVKLII